MISTSDTDQDRVLQEINNKVKGRKTRNLITEIEITKRKTTEKTLGTIKKHTKKEKKGNLGNKDQMKKESQK